MGLIWMQGYEWSNSVHLMSKPTFIENQFIIQTYWYISNLFSKKSKIGWHFFVTFEFERTKRLFLSKIKSRRSSKKTKVDAVVKNERFWAKRIIINGWRQKKTGRNQRGRSVSSMISTLNEKRKQLKVDGRAWE